MKDFKQGFKDGLGKSTDGQIPYGLIAGGFTLICYIISAILK